VGKADEVAALAAVFEAYDLVCMQEIRDIAGTALPVLMAKLNEGSSTPKFNSLVSARLGRTSSKEQYAIIWRIAADLSVDVAGATVYDENTIDVFEREPFLVPITLYPSTTQPLALTLVVIHVAPSDAVVEIDALVDVFDSLPPGTNALLLGDFNADCSYVSNSAWPSIRLRTDARFEWTIGDDTDSNVASSSCAYDRIVAAGPSLRARVVAGSPRVWRYDLDQGVSAELTKRVSDHYPVELKIALPITVAPVFTPTAAPSAAVPTVAPNAAAPISAAPTVAPTSAPGALSTGGAASSADASDAAEVETQVLVAVSLVLAVAVVVIVGAIVAALILGVIVMKKKRNTHERVVDESSSEAQAYVGQVIELAGPVLRRHGGSHSLDATPTLSDVRGGV
jgi:endonuclease/exonuclease/phosphatase family metal-dependent hydrolase